MANLFTRTGTGIGLSFSAIPMGGSDLARFHYSYDDLPAGQTDPTLAGFSIAHDLADIVPLMQQARALNPQLVVMATPWSPPGWMKTSGSLIGGSLLASAYAPFANYFVKYIQAYQAAGIPIDYVSLQNEPLYVPGDYPGHVDGRGDAAGSAEAPLASRSHIGGAVHQGAGLRPQLGPARLSRHACWPIRPLPIPRAWQASRGTAMAARRARCWRCTTSTPRRGNTRPSTPEARG